MTWDPPSGPPGWNTPPGAPPFGPPPQQQGFGPPQQQQGYGPPQHYPQPDRSATVLVLGIMGIVATFIGCAICGPLAIGSLGLSIPALVMGKRDLRAIDEGRMSPHSRGNTMIGYVLGIVGTVLGGLVGVAMIVVVLIYGAAIIAALAAGPPQSSY